MPVVLGADRTGKALFPMTLYGKNKHSSAANWVSELELMEGRGGARWVSSGDEEEWGRAMTKWGRWKEKPFGGRRKYKF